MQIETERQGDIAILRWSNPPLNALSAPLRAALGHALRAQIDDPGVRAIVLGAAGVDFCTALSDATGEPALSELCALIESAPKPVIVALQGAVMGDGLELALACHYRLGARDMRVGVPGIRVELPPHAGATQRLPRLCGAGAALDLLLQGAPRPPMPGLLDAPLADDALAAALCLARATRAPRPTRARTDGLGEPAAFMARVAESRAALAPGPLQASRRIVTCVEGALVLPFEAGLAMERAAHDDCAASPASHALRHLSRAEARALALPEAAGGRAQAMGRVAILGGTAQAGELALACLDAGCEVLLVEVEPEGQAVVLERLLGLYDDAVAQGTLTADERDRRLVRVQPDAGFDDLARVDVVWESGPDVPELKRELWSAIGLLARPGALLLASGNLVAPALLAEAAGRSGDLVGVHLTGPAHTAPLAELRPAPGAGADAVAGALALLRRLQCCPVGATDVPGGLAQHLSQALWRAIEALLVAGHRTDAIDRALLDYGFRQGPCAQLDLMGLDHAVARLHGPGGEASALLEALVAEGLTGARAREGLLTWGEQGPLGEPEHSRLIMQVLGEAGAPLARDVAPDQVAHVCAAALADAGAALVAAGHVARAGDIDVAAVHGLGFPDWRGGPMMAADQRGLLRVEREAALAGGEARVSPLLAECIKNGTALARLGDP